MRVLLLTCALAACTASAQNNLQNEAGNEAQNAAAIAVTGEKAASLPIDRLTDLVFRQLGTRMTTVSRPSNPNGLVSPPVMRLVFASAQHSTGTVGLCAAIRAQLDYGYGGADHATTPEQVSMIRAGEVYKVTGSVEPYVEQTQDRVAEEDQRCAAAGPVIPASEGDVSRAYYFTFEGEELPEMALLALQQAITDAQQGRYRTVGCAASARSSPECRNPVALLGGLNLGNLVSLQIALPGLSGNRNVIRARFLIPGAPRAQLYWSVAVEADIARPPNEAESIERLGRTEIGRSGADVLN